MTRSKKWRTSQEEIIGNILKEVELEDFQQKLIRDKWINHLAYMHWKAGRSCWNHYTLQVIILVCGITIPVLVNLDVENKPDWIRYSITSLGLLTSLATGLNQLYKHEQKWIHYRKMAELLRIEGYAFLSKSSDYSKFKTHKEAFTLFSTKIDEIMKNDLADYRELIITKQKEEDK